MASAHGASDVGNLARNSQRITSLKLFGLSSMQKCRFLMSRAKMEKTFTAHSIVSLCCRKRALVSAAVAIVAATPHHSAWESESGDEATFPALASTIRFETWPYMVTKVGYPSVLCIVRSLSQACASNATVRASEQAEAAAVALTIEDSDATTATSTSTSAAALKIAVNWHSLERLSVCSFLFRQSIGAVAFQLLHRLVASYQNQVWFQFSTWIAKIQFGFSTIFVVC